MRPIDADALIEYLKEMWGKWDEDDWYEAQAKDAMEDDIEIVNKQPTLDVAPVVHGEWITRDHWYYCSNCGHEMFFTGTFDEEQRYCYYCGAKMDGERKEGAE